MMQKSHSRRKPAPAKLKSAPEVVSRGQLARLLAVSETTLGKWIARYEGAFPVVARGGRGVAWQFHPPSVILFLAERRRAEADAAGASLAGRILEARLRRLTLDNRNVEAGLVDAGEVMRLASLAVAEMRACTAEFFTRIGQDLGWRADMTASVISRSDQIFTRGLAPVESALAPHGSTPNPEGPHDV